MNNKNFPLQKSPHFSVGGLPAENSQVMPRHAKDVDGLSDNNVKSDGALENNQMQVIRPSSQQQVSRPSDELQGGQNPQPLQAPQNHRHLDDTDNTVHNGKANKNDNANNNNNNNYKNDDSLPNEQKSDVRFESRNGNIVPVGPNDGRDQYALPIPYENQEQQRLNNEQQQPAPAKQQQQQVIDSQQDEVEQPKQVLAPPNNVQEKPNVEKSEKKDGRNDLSSKGPMMVPILRPQAAAQGQSGQLDNEQLSVGDPNDFDWAINYIYIYNNKI